MKRILHSLTGTEDIIRGEDRWGSGAYGAPRGDRLHRGVDIVVAEGAAVFAPFNATIIREATPYEDDDRYTGVLLAGIDAWADYEIKLFYLRAPHEGTVVAGEPLGIAQDLSARYPDITNHVHLELWHHGEVIDPTSYLTSTSPDEAQGNSI